MEITDYQYKIVERKWGKECLFAVRTSDGKWHNDVIAVDAKMTDEAVKTAVDGRVVELAAIETAKLTEVADGDDIK